MTYEDYAIDFPDDDLYFDSRGDIAANTIPVSDDIRRAQIQRDLYHRVSVETGKILAKNTLPERTAVIKQLLQTDNRIKSINVEITPGEFTTANVKITSVIFKEGVLSGT